MKGEMNVLVSWALDEGSHQGFSEKASLASSSPVSSKVVLG